MWSHEDPRKHWYSPEEHSQQQLPVSRIRGKKDGAGSWFLVWPDEPGWGTLHKV